MEFPLKKLSTENPMQSNAQIEEDNFPAGSFYMQRIRRKEFGWVREPVVAVSVVRLRVVLHLVSLVVGSRDAEKCGWWDQETKGNDQRTGKYGKV